MLTHQLQQQAKGENAKGDLRILKSSLFGTVQARVPAARPMGGSATTTNPVQVGSTPQNNRQAVSMSANALNASSSSKGPA